MRFSWNWIKELAGIDKSVNEASELLSLKSFEVEDVSEAGDDTILEIKVLANRPDCLSHLGVARELCALSGRRFNAPSYEYKVGEHPAVGIKVEDELSCPRYSGLVVRGVKIGQSPSWLRERLEICGLKSINNVVDVTNYVMLELGQPMHAFDLKLLDSPRSGGAGKIIVRHAKDGETLKALDEANTEYKLDSSMLVIADGSGPVAIAGVKGGVGTGISDSTTDILLEAANFAPQSVRATSRKLDLRTDASIRFSYGIDPNLTVAALARAAELIRKVADGNPDSSVIDVYPQPKDSTMIALDPEHVRSLLGLNIGVGQMSEILNSLGFEVHDNDDLLNVVIPTRRLDVVSSEDLIEEIGRVYGYDAIPSIPPLLPIYDERSWVKEDDSQNDWDEYEYLRERQNIAHVLAGAGYSEVYNYVFLSDELKDLLNLSDVHELAQPQSSEYRWLRTSLTPRLLVNARDNLRFMDKVKLFETGHVFKHLGSKEGSCLGLVLARKGSKDDMFYELKGAIDLLLERLGIKDHFYDDEEKDFSEWDAGAVNATIKGKQALIRLEGSGQVIGFIGEVSGRMTEKLKLKGLAIIAELDLRALIEHAQNERAFEPLPKYPSVIRDIAIMVGVDIKVDDILQTVQSADMSGIVRDVDVFDIFVPTGKEKLKSEGDTPDYGKSVAFHVTYRADDHTLTEEEVANVESAIKKSLQEKIGAQIR